MDGYIRADTSPVGPQHEVEARNGEHAHWSTYDLKLEGSRYHRLHAVIAIKPFDSARAKDMTDQIEALAQSYGYGQADSYFADTAGMTDEEIDADDLRSIYRDDLMRDWTDGDFFDHVTQSTTKFKDIAATPEAKTLAYDLFNKVSAAFVRGRDLYIEQNPKVEPSSPSI